MGAMLVGPPRAGSPARQGAVYFAAPEAGTEAFVFMRNTNVFL